MTFAEIKRQVPRLSPEQRQELMALIADAVSLETGERAEELSRRMARMDAGEKYTMEDLERLHRELIAQGR